MGPQVRFCERCGGAIPRAYSTSERSERNVTPGEYGSNYRRPSGRVNFVLILFEVRNIPVGDGEIVDDEPLTRHDINGNLAKSTMQITEHRLVAARFIVGRLLCCDLE